MSTLGAFMRPLPPRIGLAPSYAQDPSWYANNYNVGEIHSFMTAVWNYTYNGTPITDAMLAQGAKYGFTVASAQNYLNENTTYYEGGSGAGTVAETTSAATPGYPVGYGWVKIPADPMTGRPEQYIYTIVDANGNPTSGSARTEYVYVCGYENVTTTIPEQPYIPPRAAIEAVASQTIIDLNLGWNAGARSVAFLKGSGKVEFKVADTVIGVVVGFNDAGTDPGYTNIDKAWYFTKGIARIYENGVEKFYAGQYVTGDVFAVKRVDGIVTYWKNDALIYTSETPLYAELFLDASLYAGDDAVFDPEFTELMFGEVSLQPLAGVGRGQAVRSVNWSDGYLRPMTSVGGISPTMVGQGANVAFEPIEVEKAYGSNFLLGGSAAVAMLPLTVFSRPANRSDASMAALVGLGSDKVYGQSAVSFEPLEVDAQGGMPLPSFALANTAMLYLTGGGSGLTGGIVSSAASMPALDGLGSGDDSLVTLRSYGESEVSLHPLLGAGYAYEGNQSATMLTIVGGFFDASAPVERSVVMTSDMTVATVIAIQRSAFGEMLTTTSMVTEMEYQAILNAVMRSLVMMSFAVPVFDDVSQAWVVNANTGASSRYEDYPFNSFGKIGARYYGCKSDGLYLLEGDTDNGMPVRASINFGNSNFGTSKLKGCTNAYIGLSSTGNVFLKVTADGKEYTYKARASDEQMKVQRVDVGRGIRANYLQFELYNNDGCDFEMDSIEFLVVPLSRRI